MVHQWLLLLLLLQGSSKLHSKRPHEPRFNGVVTLDAAAAADAARCNRSSDTVPSRDTTCSCCLFRMPEPPLLLLRLLVLLLLRLPSAYAAGPLAKQTRYLRLQVPHKRVSSSCSHSRCRCIGCCCSPCLRLKMLLVVQLLLPLQPSGTPYLPKKQQKRLQHLFLHCCIHKQQQ